MSNPYEDKVHDWWYDNEFNCHYILIERPDGQLRLVLSPKAKEEKKDGI